MKVILFMKDRRPFPGQSEDFEMIIDQFLTFFSIIFWGGRLITNFNNAKS